jgi:electron transfer flavoprotein beta subunit
MLIMKIIVLVKEVPDTYGPRTLDLETGLAQRGASEAVLDEIGERALEVALAYADSHPGTEVVAMTMGPATAIASLRKALSMGAGSAVHLADEALAGSDYATTAQALAAAIARTGFDLVIAGDRSTDGAGGVVPAMIAEHLGLPHATALASVQISADAIVATRVTGVATVELAATLPAVISITEALPDARYPTLKGIMSAKKKPLETLTVADLGIDLLDEDRAHSIVVAVAARPARVAGTKMIDEGDAAERLVAFLADAKLL